MRLLRSIPVFVLLGGAFLAPAQPVAPGPPALRKLAKKRLRSGQAPSPTAILERLQQLSPEAREAVFEQIPEGRRDQVRRRFDAFNRLSPEERDRLGEHLVAFINMAPQRQEIARAVFRRFAAQPADRQKVMQEEVRILATLSPEDRRSRVNTDEFRNRFSAPEKVLMFDMARMFPGKKQATASEVIQQQ